MIWHIFKKDVKLLWPMALVQAALQFGASATLFSMGHFPASERQMRLVQMLWIAVLLGMGVVITSAVHQDPIPGVRQDWLVRPIRRRDLWAAKLLFVVLMVQLPIFMADFLEALADGFPAGPVLTAAASRSLFLFFGACLPFFAIASLTRNLTEAVAGGAVVFFAAVSIFQLFRADVTNSVLGSGLGWISDSSVLVITLCGSIAVLAVQYFRRRTIAARYATALFALLCVLATLIPWRSAFAIQSALSANPEMASPVAVDFAPASARYTRTADLPLSRDADLAFPVYMPLRISGIPSDAALRMDHAELLITEPGGRKDAISPRGGLLDSGYDAAGRPVSTYDAILIPADLYRRIKDKPVSLTIHYYLTLVRQTSSAAIPAVGGDRHISGVGWCMTRVNGLETAVQVRCMDAGPKMACTATSLKHIPTGAHNPERFSCEGTDYSPFIGWQLYPPDALSRFGTNLPFRDPSGLAKFPVDGTMLRESQVFLRAYRAADHFTRTVTIPDIRLSDWEASLGTSRAPF